MKREIQRPLLYNVLNLETNYNDHETSIASRIVGCRHSNLDV
jgi:hypothetical protein